MTGLPGRWIRRFHPAAPERPRVVCFPHAGGSASYFQPFSAALQPHGEVLAIQYPGRQDRFGDPRLESITELADAIVAELRDWLDRPLVFFGHSMGATVAFEVARRVEAIAPDRLRGLVSSARIAPSRRPTGLPHTDDRSIVAEMDRLRGGGPVSHNAEVLALALPALRSDFTAVRTYRCPPQRRLRCPITAFLGVADPAVTVEEVDDWARHTTGRFARRMFPGGHHYLEDQWPGVAAAVLAELPELARQPGRISPNRRANP